MKISIESDGQTIVIEDAPERLVGELAEVFENASTTQLVKVKESTCIHEQYKCCSLAEKLLSVASMAYKELGI